MEDRVREDLDAKKRRADALLDEIERDLIAKGHKVAPRQTGAMIILNPGGMLLASIQKLVKKKTVTDEGEKR